MKKAWFFDLDGTLADTDGDIRLAWKAAMAEMGLECPSFDRDFVAGPPIEKMAEKLFGAAYTPAMGAELRRRFGEKYDTCGFPATVEYPGIPETLARLKASGAYLAIVTNKRHRGALALAEKFGWNGIFDRIYSCDMYDATEGRYDKTRLLARAIAESGAAKDDCAMVGDTAGDVEAAAANGIGSVGALWGYGGAEALAGADRVAATPGGAAAEPKRISVVIPTYCRKEMLCRCVESVLACGWENLEVIVADDCSPDDTRETVEKRFGGDKRVKYARTEKNGFTSAARNCGAAIATGDIFFFLDDDNELEPGCLSEIAACFERHPAATFVAPLTLHWKGDGHPLVWTLGTPGYNPWTSQPRETYRQNMELSELPPLVDFPTLASPNAMAVPRETYFRTGGYDEGYGMQFDEIDFGIRAVKWLGGEGYICAKAVTRHFGWLDPSEAGELRALGLSNPRRAYAFGRNRCKFSRRHFNFVQALSCCFVFAPLSAVYYGWKALKNRRPAIAWGYLKGTLAGMLGLYTTRLPAREGARGDIAAPQSAKL